MTCIAITCAGYGTAWEFDSFDEADNHPLIQYGDALISSPADILTQYNRLDIHRLLDLIGDIDLRELVLGDMAKDGMTGIERHAEKVFDKLVRQAGYPPTDPSEICDLIRQDRTQTREVLKMSDKNAPENKATATKETKAPAKKAFEDDAKITLLSDKDGKKYGTDHNPKRDGSKSAARFALYKDGMTVKQFLDAGGSVADLKWDRDKKYISIAA